MPGIKITEEDRQRIDARFICTLCKLLLYIPMLTMCGHLMCQSCIERLLRSSNPKCPSDGEELSKEKVFPDVFTKRELNGLRLHCPNPGCSWHSTYDQLEGHSQVCEHALIKCVHAQCQTKFKRSQLGEHLKSECEYRNVGCDYCGKDVPRASLKEHFGTSCENAPVTCKYCKEHVKRKDIEKHESETCEAAPAICDYHAVGCNSKTPLKRRQLREHLDQDSVSHGQLLLRYVLANVTANREKITSLERRIETLESSGGGGNARLTNEEHVQSNCEDAPATCDFSAIGCKRDGSLEREEPGQHSRTKLVEHTRLLLRYVFTLAAQFNTFIRRTECLGIVQGLRDDITDVRSGMERRIGILESSGVANAWTRNEEREREELVAELHDLHERITNLERTMSTIGRPQCREDVESQRDSPSLQSIHSYSGTLLWKIESYQRKRQDAINGVKTALYSPAFYSAQYGYKMCAKIYMNGDGFGKGTHLSLFFVVMRGDYDALQTWPMQKKITMMLLDQGNGDHMIDAFHSDPQSSSFQRPTSETDTNIAIGCPLFMRLDMLNNRQYIKDDVMFIEIIVN